MSISTERIQTINFTDALLSHFKEIAADTYERKRLYESNSTSVKSEELLGKGIWYSFDYYTALKKFKHEERLKWLVSTGVSFHGYMNKDFFNPVKNVSLPTGRSICTFIIKEKVAPTDALNSINKSINILDCDSGLGIAIYKTLKDVLGEKKFDHLFASDSPFPFQIGGGTQNPTRRLFEEIKIVNNESIRAGDLCYFSNTSEFISKHPSGRPACGFNVFCCDDVTKKYLGLGLNPEGVSENGIEKCLWNEYNGDPVEEGFLDPKIWAHLFSKSLLCNEKKSRELVNSLKDKKITWDKFQQESSWLSSKGFSMKNKLLLIISRPNLKRIELLVKATLDDIRTVFADFK